ncbi:hypothetical protein FT643_22505 [Ketobacter sp. MCCC 1A13808]|uniref:hypothetical protein n=1 Tax=Ketobacter sp. MCCC 1A13808 TaxID=2602738 RepID=UPI0012EB1857|nr:hypothetical protein [Ketobacter sp. MCCC 1A13808]MVF14911.1 hypothetical protein [Ketobacter sp. MCCC 1A13808]
MKHLKTILAIWGGLVGIGLIVCITYYGYRLTLGNSTDNNSATKDDVRFVLNWCELGDERIQSVPHSYESPRSFTGDHFDAYEILTTNISIDELLNPEVWTRGDKLEGVKKEGVKLISMLSQLDNLEWFPGDKILLSSEIFVYSWSVLFHGERAIAAKMIFVKPSENKVFYASVKT